MIKPFSKGFMFFKSLPPVSSFCVHTGHIVYHLFPLLGCLADLSIYSCLFPINLSQAGISKFFFTDRRRVFSLALSSKMDYISYWYGFSAYQFRLSIQGFLSWRRWQTKNYFISSDGFQNIQSRIRSTYGGANL